MSVNKTLTKTELAKLQKYYPAWKFAPDTTKATLTLSFKRHVDALVLIARISVHAEVLQHHPEIVFTKAKLKITTTTNKLLTTKDKDLITRIEHILVKDMPEVGRG